MDVSSYQGNVNWSKAAANGAQFAAVKATEGTYYTNPYFAQQYNGSYNAGLERGAYHFAIPSNSTGPAQADYFVAHGGGWSADGRTLPGELDIEYNPYSGGECYGLSKSQMVNWISSFDGEYAALTGRRPIIYTTTDWWSTCTGNAPGFYAESLWTANYGGTPYPLPASWKTYTAWQYADHGGTYPGDQDVFNGDHAGLVAFAYGASVPVSPSPTPGTTPGAARDSSGNELVAVTASNGSVQVVKRSPSGAFTSETDIGGAAKGGPAVASPGAGQWDVLVRGTDNAAWLNTYRNGTWSGWSSLGGRLSGAGSRPSPERPPAARP
jgi:GH25 family lysozyme M1 (1,4-beta-N-acetylmuramidase)